MSKRPGSLRLFGLWAVLLSNCTPTPPIDRAALSSELSTMTGAAGGVGETREVSEVPKGVSFDDGLSEAEVVALALWNNADLQSSLAELGFAKADLYQAGALPNPTFSLFFPIGPKQLEMVLDWGIDWLWRRPYRVAASKLDMMRVAETLVATGLDTARNARMAHADLHFARRRLALLKSAADTWSRMAKLAAARLNAGAASQLEVTAVQSDATIAMLEANRQAELVRVFEARLFEQVNLPPKTELQGRPMVFSPFPNQVPELPTLIELALASRPELRAAELAIEATGERAGLEIANIFNLIATLDANGSGPLNQGFEIGPALRVTLPIFDQNQAGRARVQAQMEQNAWRYIGVRARIVREVAESYHRLTRSMGALNEWPQRVVAPLEANVTRAEKAYAAGGATYLEVLDATRRLIEARLRGLQFEVEGRMALAELKRSLGGELKGKET